MSAQVATLALRTFANAITEARSVFETSKAGMTAWLVFYEAKQSAYAQLVAAVPHIAEIRDFWRYIQNMPVTQWQPVIEAQIEQMMRNRSSCEQCGAAEVIWPTRRCPACQEATRRETYRKSKQRARLRKRQRKCPVCGIEPLVPRQRVCLRCQDNRRRGRNQRYQKSLKQRNLRRVQPDFTREEMSTVSSPRPFTQLGASVEREAVLTTGGPA